MFKKKKIPPVGKEEEGKKATPRKAPTRRLERENKVIRPWISEKATALKEYREYVFLVHKKARKPEVKKEIEARYGVKVEGVRIILKKGKEKRFGKSMNKRSDIKKAIVKLKEGNTIDVI